ncbi:hypothetical protein [Sanguibacter suaedae]|uniref:Secreted protein n=1 Tax=Sanguibacter suaedae TaxID=2795737 RepID=A0A934MA28_9MICO|nr:hypothetical protein [Sanguibacter suaedae]MBI9113801.1 hypothetical protein [Sanguibacter suaedae]
MRTRRAISTMAIASALSVSLTGVASATPSAPSPEATVVSEAGIPAAQLAPADASESEIQQAIEEHEERFSARPGERFSTLATGDYYSYCEEGSSGLMPWTNNSPSNCYGWYYEYLDGNRISKVNMIQLKVAGETGPNPADLIEWCNNNGFYCALAGAILSRGGSYLKGLLTRI